MREEMIQDVRCVRQGLLWLFGLSMLLLMQCVMARTTRECDTLAKSISENTTLGVPLDRARRLEQSGQGCEGTGQYDISLAMLYQDGTALDDADRVAHAGLTKRSSNVPNLEQLLAGSELRRGHHDQAYALDSNADSLVMMTTTLYQLKRYDEAIAAYRQAIRMQPHLIASPTGLSEVVYALAALRRRPEAADLLKQHMTANANWQQNAHLASAARQLGLID